LPRQPASSTEVERAPPSRAMKRRRFGMGWDGDRREEMSSYQKKGAVKSTVPSQKIGSQVAWG
jgi:hypothetical protein